MTGVKGKSGKLTTLAQREERRAINLRSAKAIKEAKQSKAPKVAKPKDEAPAFEVQGWIDLKDKLACDLARRKIEQADIDVATSRVAYEKARGDLLTKQQVEAREEALADLFLAHLEEVSALVAAQVPPERINEARQRSAEWVASVRSRIADALEAEK